MSYETKKTLAMLLGCFLGGFILQAINETRIKEIRLDSRIALSEMHENAFNLGWSSNERYNQHPHFECHECHPRPL